MVYQHNRTITWALDSLAQPQPTQRFTPSGLTPIMTQVEELLDQLDEAAMGMGLSGILRAERKLWQESRDRLSDLLNSSSS